MDKDTQKRTVEALLFASNAPLSSATLHDYLPEDADLGAIMSALVEEYKDRGVNLVEISGQWAFRTAEDLGDYLQVVREEERKLSKAALETLSIIAYNQPVTRAEIENIRGVSTNKGTLDILLQEGWLKMGRRRETPGRPVTWITTNAFLDHFGLESLNALPGLDEMKASGLLDRRPAIDTVPMTSDLFDNTNEESENADNDSENESSEEKEVYS